MKCRKTKRLNIYFAILLCLFLVLLSAGVCSAEETYRITETELTKLESNLAQLRINNENKQKELITLSRLLSESQKSQQQMQTLLDNANKSLAEYEKEVKAKTRRIKLQRNIGYICCGFLAYRLAKNR